MHRRQAVIMVMFDVPTKTKIEAKAYRKLKSFLTKNGYVQFQKSVYVKLLNNTSNYNMERNKLEAVAPTEGSVYYMLLSLSTFKSIEYCSKADFDLSLFCDDVVFIS